MEESKIECEKIENIEEDLLCDGDSKVEVKEEKEILTDDPQSSYVQSECESIEMQAADPQHLLKKKEIKAEGDELPLPSDGASVEKGKDLASMAKEIDGMSMEHTESLPGPSSGLEAPTQKCQVGSASKDTPFECSKLMLEDTLPYFMEKKKKEEKEIQQIQEMLDTIVNDETEICNLKIKNEMELHTARKRVEELKLRMELLKAKEIELRIESLSMAKEIDGMSMEYTEPLPGPSSGLEAPTQNCHVGSASKDTPFVFKTDARGYITVFHEEELEEEEEVEEEEEEEEEGEGNSADSGSA